MKDIFVGNLSDGVLEGEVRQLFQAYGSVGRVNIIADRESGEPRGYGFVEMTNEGERRAAIAAVNGMELDGCTLHVNQASPKVDCGTEMTMDGLVQSVCGSTMRVVIRGYDDALRLSFWDGKWFTDAGLKTTISFLSPFSDNGYDTWVDANSSKARTTVSVVFAAKTQASGSSSWFA